MLFLNRWDSLHGLLRQAVLCENILIAGENIYELQAVITHIGDLPSQGHYVAYARNDDCFIKFDDSRVSRTSAGHSNFSSSPNEKVYVLTYVKKQPTEADAEPGVIALERPRPKFPRLASRSGHIDLDSNDDDSDMVRGDSDVILQIDTDDSGKSVGAKPSADADHAQENQIDQDNVPRVPQHRNRNSLNYTLKERQEIRQVLRSSNSVKQAVATLSASMAKFEVNDENSTTYLSRSTLRNWFKFPDRLEKLLDRLARPQPTPRSNYPSQRRPPAGSTRDGLTPALEEAVHRALEEANSMTQLIDMFKESVPGFSTTDDTASMYVARSSLHNWLTRRGVVEWFQDPSRQTWDTEYDHVFTVAMDKPERRPQPASLSTSFDVWLHNSSWTFCPTCGRRRPRCHTRSDSDELHQERDAAPCPCCCDADAHDLLSSPSAEPRSDKLLAYVTPESRYWKQWMGEINEGNLPLTSQVTADELGKLAVADIKVEYRSRRGNSELTSLQKRSVVRCRWRKQSLYDIERGPAAARAFQWLLANNSTCKAYVDRHAELVASQAADSPQPWQEIPTAELLLACPAIELAVRPWLYPLASFADSDISERLKALGWCKQKSKPSMRTSIVRKIMSRCLDYARDFPLHCLLYDMCLARTISSVVSIADQKQISAGQASSDMDICRGYWLRQVQKMEDICRQESETTNNIEDGLPSIFFTVAPAEWKYILQKTLFLDGSLTDQQDLLTLHLYQTLENLLEVHLFKEGISLERIGIAGIRQWSLRFEFQARGTLHIHVLLWADLKPGWTADDVTGRTGEKHNSKFVELLEELFHSRADVQCGDGHHNLLRYVAGYVSKASDALIFEPKQAASAERRQTYRTYRLLCKKSPMQQEIVMELAGLPMVKHSFTGLALYPPIAGSKATNSSRQHYNAYQFFLTQDVDTFGSAVGLSYMEWLRRFRLVGAHSNSIIVSARNTLGPGGGKSCAIAMQFPFELLDIYVGAWAACFLKNMHEARLLPETNDDAINYPSGFEAEKTRRASFEAPEGCRFLKAVLCLDQFQTDHAPPEIFAPDPSKLLASMQDELKLRGLGADRIATFRARVHACTLLLLAVRDGREDASLWSAKRVPDLPNRVWSPEQARVLRHQ